MTLPARTVAAQATRDFFFGKAWKPGKRDCAKMSTFHLEAMGHRPPLVAELGAYGSVKAGIRRLRALGYADLPAALDAHFQRIPPAMAWVGDIVQIPSVDDAIGALTVALGNGRVLGYHEHAVGAAILQPKAYIAAWRIPYAGPGEGASS